jgi:peptide/nickel transport system substrate-binding protein
MAARMGALVDPDTGVAREGAIEVIDDMTVQVTYPTSDITLIAGIADYPAAVQHRDMIGTNPLDHGIGTGAYRVTDYEVGVSAPDGEEPRSRLLGRRLSRRGLLHRPRPGPGAWFAGAEAGEFDMTYETVGEFVDLFSAVGWEQSRS